MEMPSTNMPAGCSASVLCVVPQYCSSLLSSRARVYFRVLLYCGASSSHLKDCCHRAGDRQSLPEAAHHCAADSVSAQGGVQWSARLVAPCSLVPVLSERWGSLLK